MTKILAVSGSLRRESFNTKLAREFKRVAADGIDVEVVTLHGIPLYDGDLEAAEGIPDAVIKLHDQMRDADGVLWVTPEYNGSMPGVMKNAFDWLSRVERGAMLRGLKIALAGASAGGFGTVLGQEAWLSPFRRCNCELFVGATVFVSRASDAFDSEGKLVDERTAQSAEQFLSAFAEWIDAD